MKSDPDRIAYDVVICTHNRVQPLVRVLNGLCSQTRQPRHIFLIDSSIDKGSVRSAISFLVSSRPDLCIQLVRACHANVAYQRWLGFKVARSEVLAYFDDDIVINEPNMMERVLALFSEPGVVGASVDVEYHNPLVHDPALRSFTGHLRQRTFWRSVQRGIDWFTGLPYPNPGQVGLCGVRGPMPAGRLVEVAWLPGPCMVFSRNALSDRAFSWDLMAVFERRLAIGEDLVISYAAGKTGRLVVIRDIAVRHPGDSETVAYHTAVKQYARTFAYSRLFLSLQIGGHGFLGRFTCRVHYYYYALWRAIGAALRLFSPPYWKHYNYLLGWILGVLLTLRKPCTHAALTPGINWATDAQKDTMGLESLGILPCLPLPRATGLPRTV